MEASSVPAVRVIDSFQVSPAPGSVPEQASIPFTFFDLKWIFSQPIAVDRIFFYKFPHSTMYFLSNHLPALKSSLSVVLQAFYPLAGTFRRRPGTDGRYELCYKEGDAVAFTLAELDGGFFDVLSGNCARSSALLEQLVPPLPQSDESDSLLAVQVTLFPEQGIALGVTVNHLACDGTSSTQFLHAWADTCRTEVKFPNSTHVVIDRTLIHDPLNLYSKFYNRIVKHRLSSSKGEDKASPHIEPSTIVLASFTLKQEHILGLKKMVSDKARHMNKSFHCSTLVVAFAYTWVGHVRAQCTDTDKKSCFLFSADFRQRLQPPLPATYFGNCVWTGIADANPIDLMSNDGFFAAAEAIGKAIDRLCVSQKSSEDIVNLFTSLDEVSWIVSAGSPKFKVYDVDFGWGKPAKVEITSIARTGSVSVADSREEQGGVEIGVALPKDKMACFEKYFFSGLELFSNFCV